MHRTFNPIDPSSVRGKLELKAAASKAAAEREGQLKRRRDVAIEQASPETVESEVGLEQRPCHAHEQ